MGLSWSLHGQQAQATLTRVQWGRSQDCQALPCFPLHKSGTSRRIPAFVGGGLVTLEIWDSRITSICGCVGDEPHCFGEEVPSHTSPRLCQTALHCRCRIAVMPLHVQLPGRTASITNRLDSEGQLWQASLLLIQIALLQTSNGNLQLALGEETVFFRCLTHHSGDGTRARLGLPQISYTRRFHHEFYTQQVNKRIRARFEDYI